VRILLVSDLHYHLPQWDWVVGEAAGYDLVVVAGDLLDISSSVPLHSQIVVVLHYLSLLRQAGTTVVVSGNHDLTGPDAAGEQSAPWLAEARAAGIPTDGDSLSIDGTLVTACPWWDGPVGRARVEAQLAADAPRRPAWWVWVYHWPPLGSPTCWTGQRSYGDPDLVGWIERFAPQVVLTGHVHQSPFTPDGSWIDRVGETWIFNAGRQIGPEPAHIELDLDGGRAVWHSLMGTEDADLRQPSAPARTVF